MALVPMPIAPADEITVEAHPWRLEVVNLVWTHPGAKIAAMVEVRPVCCARSDPVSELADAESVGEYQQTYATKCCDAASKHSDPDPPFETACQSLRGRGKAMCWKVLAAV